MGLETAFPVLYSQLVVTGKVTLARLIDAMAIAPRKRFNIAGGKLTPGGPADLCVWNLQTPYTIDAGEFLSKGKSSPFDGMQVIGKNRMTIAGGTIVWER